MDEPEVKGVFLHSKNLDSEFMIKCLQMLVNNFPEVKITSVVSDESHFGFRVHFSSPKDEVVLARKYLLVSGENVRIGPLRASLTIHGVLKDGGEKYEVELRESISNKFGKLKYIIAVSNPENEMTKNLRAILEVPEIEELKIFNHDGSPDMFVSLPNSTEKLKVTFHCRRCTQDGHAQQNCPNLPQLKEEKAKKTNGSIDSKNFSSDAAKPFQIRLESPNSYAEKIGREEILKTGILSENQNDKEGKPESSSSSENSSSNHIPFVKIKKEVEDHDDVKNSEKLLDAKRLTDNSLNNDSNSNMDDEIQVLDCRSNSSNSRPSFTFKAENRDEETNSNEDFSSATKYMAENFSSSSHNMAGPSSRNSTTPTKPIIAVEVTKILSPQLQACINTACDEFKILDRNKLDAFLIHVKKKSNPLRIASNYTSNAGKLKDQLQKIITLFYNTPQAGTKDDTQFIKWLTGLVERFEGTIPKKRKRSDRGDSPNKK